MLPRLIVLTCLLLTALAHAGSIVLPQGRVTYACGEQVELAVAGLAKGEAATLTLRPVDEAVVGVALPLTGDGGTVALALPAHSLAPGAYDLFLDPAAIPLRVTIVDGVRPTSFLLSLEGNPAEVARAGGTVAVLRDLRFGVPAATADLRGTHSPGYETMVELLAAKLTGRTPPLIVPGLLPAAAAAALAAQDQGATDRAVASAYGSSVLGQHLHLWSVPQTPPAELPMPGATGAGTVSSPLMDMALATWQQGLAGASRTWCDVRGPAPRVPPDDAAWAAAYRLALNATLATEVTGIGSPALGAQPSETLAALHAPVLSYGPLIGAFAPAEADVALLYCDGELAVRTRAAGSTIKVEHLPENTAAGAGDLALTEEGIVGNYQAQICATLQALTRAGYPARVVTDDALAASGGLRGMQALVVVGQTAALSAAATRAIANFVKGGGKVVVDPSTTVTIPGAVVAEVDLAEPGYRQAVMRKLADTPGALKTAREASYFHTTFASEAPARDAVAGLRKALQQSKARSALVGDSSDLACVRLTGGDGAMLLALNAREELPRLEDQQTYATENLAPAELRYSLGEVDVNRGLLARLSSKRPPVVYVIEGADWSRVSRVDDPLRPATYTFAAGEMKLYLVAPQVPTGITVSATPRAGLVEVSARLRDVHMPWPVQVTLLRPDGTPLYTVWRALDAKGEYRESFPLGRNAPTGTYAVNVSSPVADLRSQEFFELKASSVEPVLLSAPARVFDGEALTAFLRSKPALTIAVGATPEHRPLAEQLAAGLRAKGCTVEVVGEGDLRRVGSAPAGAAELGDFSWERHVIALGDGGSSTLVAAAQASELPWQCADAQYPGPQRALVSYLDQPVPTAATNPPHHLILIAASDPAGVAAGLTALLGLFR